MLSENLEEEMGQYDEETLVECEKMGIKRESVEGIPHRQLFVEFVELLETKLARSYSKFMPDYICAQLQLAIEESTKHGKLGLLAILYFGSELIVPEIYSSILDGLRLSMGLTNEEAKFLILHIDMDKVRRVHPCLICHLIASWASNLTTACIIFIRYVTGSCRCAA